MLTKGQVTVELLLVPSPRTAFRERGSLRLAPGGNPVDWAASSASDRIRHRVVCGVAASYALNNIRQAEASARALRDGHGRKATLRRQEVQMPAGVGRQKRIDEAKFINSHARFRQVHALSQGHLEVAV